MNTPHCELMYHPYTKKARTIMRCVFLLAGVVLLLLCWKHPNAIVIFVFLCVLCFMYEVFFRGHRRHRETILNEGKKITATVVDKVIAWRRRACYLVLEYEYHQEKIKTAVWVADQIWHKYQLDDPVDILVSPNNPKSCVVVV